MPSSDESSAAASDDDGLAMLVASSLARKKKRTEPTQLTEDDAKKPNPFAQGLHEVTTASTSGLGAKLAGTQNPVDDLWWRDSMPWTDSSSNPPPPSPPPPAVAARLELRRAARLARLRVLFHDRCKAVPLTMPPINALERWRFLCKWQEQEEGAGASRQPHDALLPTGAAQPADAAFASDLRRAGVAPAAAEALVTSVREASVEAADDVARLQRALEEEARPTGAQPLHIATESLPNGVMLLRASDAPEAPAAVAAGGVEGTEAEPSADAPAAGTGVRSDEAALSARVTAASVIKLHALYRRCARVRVVSGSGDGGAASSGGGDGSSSSSSSNAAAGSGALPSAPPPGSLPHDDDSLARDAAATIANDGAFAQRLFALVLRYEAIGGAGFQAALGGVVMRELQSLLGVNFETFASPLNCYYGHYCSAFADIDGPFGSQGSFATFAPESGAYECNVRVRVGTKP